jgi:predicted RNase H-like HicB family nuclease
MEKVKKNIRYVLTEYVEQALELASYDKLEDGTFAGNIVQCAGVISFGKTLRECQSELRSTLEDWVLLGLKLGQKLPRMGGIDLNHNSELHGRHAASSRSGRKKSASL